MRFYLFISVIGFLFPFSPARAATSTVHKYALILGGGEEPPGPTTIFDKSLKGMGSKLSEAGYQTSVLFDGGHSESESIARSVDPQAQPFTLNSTQSKLDEMIHKIDQNMRSGDQLMVVVDTHGGVPDGLDDGADPSNVPPHDVSTGDSQLFNMGQLAVLKKHAKAKGVRLAILDMSCYSGSSLRLADANTCVVTATSADSIGIEQFVSDLSDRLHAGRSLEDSFLEARQSIPYGKPEISTPANQAAMSALRNIENQIQFSTDDIVPDGNESPSDENQCDGAITAVSMQVRRLMKTMSAGLDTSEQFELKKRLVDYLKLRQKAVEESEFLDRTAGHVGDMPVSYRFLLDLDGNLAGLRDALQSETDPREKQAIQEVISSTAGMKGMRADLLKSDPKFAQIVKNQAIKSGTNVTEEDYKLIRAAGRVSEYERAAYAKLYAAESGRQAAQGKSNPCKDFKF